MDKRSCRNRSELTDHCRLQVYEHSAWNVLPRAGFAEESVERVIPAADSLIRRHLPVRLDAVLQAVQLPACIANLHSGLADVD